MTSVRRSAVDIETTPLVLVMVGLPARGKTYMSRKLARYLRWQGYRARVFNVGTYRRERLGTGQPARFFDPDNVDGVNDRTRMALQALDDVFQWIREGGQIAIYDATNSTRARRDLVHARCTAEGLRVMMLESVATDPELVNLNVSETKVTSPDYAGADPDAAVADFRARIAHYERSYEPLGDAEADRSWVKIVDVGKRVVVNGVRGYVPSRLVFYLMNLHLAPRTIWLTRHGESEFNAAHRIGGDPPLTARGRDYASRLARFLEARIDTHPSVWCSTLHRAVQTAGALPWTARPLRALDEIDAGVCDGWTYEEVNARMPDEYDARQADKLRYRYPRGESYQDVIARLNPVIIEIERSRRPVVVVGHQAVLRALYAYLAGESQEACPHLDLPLHTVIELVPKAYGCSETRHRLDDG